MCVYACFYVYVVFVCVRREKIKYVTTERGREEERHGKITKSLTHLPCCYTLCHAISS